MEINDIINDAIHYPLSDYKKFLILGLPNLILSILFFILILQALGLDSIADLPADIIIYSPIFSTFIITTIIFFIALVIGVLILEGIQLSVIRETINGNDIIPNLELSKNFVDGLKCLILSIVYMLIPTVVYLILVFVSLGILHDDAVIFIIILTVLLVIVAIILSFLYVVSICRLAQTDSLEEALKIRNIYEITKNIGFVKIFLVLIFSLVLNLIISLIGSVLEIIPVIGFIILTYIFYTYFIIVTSRSYGLLYRDEFINAGQFNGTFNQQVVDKTPIVNKEYEFNKDNNMDYTTPKTDFDFQPSQEGSNVNQDVQLSDIKKCSRCGYSNPNYANICSNCGNKL